MNNINKPDQNTEETTAIPESVTHTETINNPNIYKIRTLQLFIFMLLMAALNASGKNKDQENAEKNNKTSVTSIVEKAPKADNGETHSDTPEQQLQQNFEFNLDAAERAKLQAFIEREISKFSPVVASLIVSDYTTEEAKEHIKLRFVPSDYFKLDIINAEAEYNPDTDELTLPDRIKTIEKIIAHETWHGIYDNSRKKGIIHTPGYQGPSKKEIDSFTRELIRKSKFNSAIEEKEQLVRLLDIQNQANRSVAKFLSVISVVAKEIDSYALYTRPVNDIEDILKEVKVIDRNTERGEFIEKNKSWMTLQEEKIMEFSKKYNEIKQKIIDKKYKNPEDTIKEFKELIQQFDKIIEKEEDYLYYLHDEINRKIIENLVSEMNECMKEPEKYGTPKENATFFNEFIQDIIENREIVFELKKVVEESQEREIQDIISRASLNQTANSPDEIMARIVDAVVNLDYGKTTLASFPPFDPENDSQENRELCEKIFNFLGSMKFKGESLYGVNVAKYRLGMRMIEDGYSPEEVKKALEYATEYTYAFRHYRFQTANFKIKGNIPYQKDAVAFLRLKRELEKRK